MNRLTRWRFKQQMAEEQKRGEYGRWWLSFASEEKGFLGVAIVEALGPTAAVVRTHALDINPGGQVSIMEVREDYPISTELMNRLLDKDEVKAAFGPADAT